MDLLKLDIEGAEYLVMKDLVKTEKIKFIKEIIMEYHHTPLESMRQLPQLLTWLEDNNFYYELIPPGIHAYRKN